MLGTDPERLWKPSGGLEPSGWPVTSSCHTAERGKPRQVMRGAEQRRSVAGDSGPTGVTVGPVLQSVSSSSKV
eukprot:7238603-Prymnesium_polylepis.1